MQLKSEPSLKRSANGKIFSAPHREAIKYRFDGSPLIGPEKRKKKAIRTARCLSVASFGLFRFFLSIAGSGQSSGSPFLWLLAFGEAKESDCPAA